MFGADDTIGIDELDARRHGFDLGLTKAAGDGVKLTIHVADTDVVEVHKGELPDTGTGERLNSPRAHAADADDADMGGAQAFLAGDAVKTEDAAEAGFVIGHGMVVKTRDPRRCNFGFSIPIVYLILIGAASERIKRKIKITTKRRAAAGTRRLFRAV